MAEDSLCISSLNSFLTMAAPICSIPFTNVSLTKLNVSSGFPLKKRSFPRNFRSSSRIDKISLSPMWKDVAVGVPPEMENDLHFDGLSFIPIDVNKQISKVKKLPERYFKVMQALRSLGSIVSLD